MCCTHLDESIRVRGVCWAAVVGFASERGLFGDLARYQSIKGSALLLIFGNRVGISFPPPSPSHTVQMRLLEASQAGDAAQVRLLLAQGYPPDKDRDDVSGPVCCILNK